MRARFTLAAVLGAAALSIGGPPAGAGDLADRSFVPGDTLEGAVDFAHDVDDAMFDGLRGMKLRLAVTPGEGMPAPRAEVLGAYSHVKGPLGRVRAGRFGTATLRWYGQHRLRITPAGEALGTYTVATQAIFPKSARTHTVSVRPGKSMEGFAKVDLLRGATLDLLVTPPQTTTLTLAAVDPRGIATDLAPSVTTDESGRLVVSAMAVPTTGTWRIRVGGFTGKEQRASVLLTPHQPTGGATRHLVECVLPPADQPSVVPITYAYDEGFTVGEAAGTVGVTSPAGGSAIGEGSGLRPDFTQISFLTGGPDAAAFAPFVVRPADAAPEAGSLHITYERVALGVMGLHPWVARLEAAQREAFFDAAPAAPTFPFLSTAVRLALADDPLSLSDPVKYPEIYRAGDKAVRETLAAMGWGPGAKSFHTPWGDFEEPATFDVQGTATGEVVLINPRHVFYGVQESGPRSNRRMHLVRPRDMVLHGFPPAPSDPYTEAFQIIVGRTDFTADALDSSFDLATAEGLGTTANALCAVLQVFQLATPTRVSPVDLTLEVMNRFTALGVVPADPAFLEELGAISWSGTPQQIVGRLEDFLGRNDGRNWKKVAALVWQWTPNAFPATYVNGAGRFVGGYLAVVDLNDAMPFLTDLGRVSGEPAILHSVVRQGDLVTATGDTVFSIVPDFSFAPDVPFVAEAAHFDPSPTAFSAAPATSPSYVWSFYDVPGEPPTVIDRGTDNAAVEFAFTVAGFHAVTLAVTVGDTTSRVFHIVQVESLPNLGFETGDMSFWTVETHTWFDPTPGSESSHSAIVGPGFDPEVSLLPTVFHGLYSLRIEDDGTGAYVSAASRTIRVPNGGMVLKFAWAAVLEDPQHAPKDQPYFDIKVHDDTTGEDLYAIHHYSNEPGFPWQTEAGGYLKWVPWQPVTIDLTGRDGHDIAMSAIAADCEQGGHFGYVYFDAP